jgi:hypothetical protein
MSGLRRQVFGMWLTIESVQRSPRHTRPSERFINAVSHAGIDFDELLPGPHGTHEQAQARYAALQALADLLDAEERLLAALDEPFALGLMERDGARLEVEFHGGRAGVVDLRKLKNAFSRNPLNVLMRAEAATASSHERLHAGAVSLPHRPLPHPLDWAIQRVAGQIARSNQRLPPTAVRLDDLYLQARLVDAVLVLESDTRRLCELAGIALDEEHLAGDLHLVLPATFASPASPHARPKALVCWTAPLGGPRAVVHRRDDVDWRHTGDFQALEALLQAKLQLERPIRRLSVTSTASVIAGLLGYDEQDIVLEAAAPGKR